MLRRYVHGSGIDDPIVWYEGAGLTSRRHLFADRQGSIVGIADASGASTGTNTYDEYGIPGSSNSGRFAYTGQIWLSELGMYHYKARIYSPSLGRFLQTDPIGYDDQINLYAYVGNDPVGYTDPTGKDRYKVEITGSLAFIGGGEFGVSLEVDTNTIEVGGSIEVGALTGFGGEIGASFERESSSVKGNEISVSTDVKAEAELGVRLGKNASLAASAEASMKYEAKSNGSKRSEVTARAEATAGDRHVSTDGKRAPDRYGAGASATAGATVKVQGNTSLRDLWNNVKSLWKRFKD